MKWSLQNFDHVTATMLLGYKQNVWWSEDTNCLDIHTVKHYFYQICTGCKKFFANGPSGPFLSAWWKQGKSGGHESCDQLNLGQNWQFFIPWNLEIWRITWKTIGHLPYATSSFVQHFIAIGEFKLELVRKRQIWFKIGDLFSCVTLKFDRWPWKTIGHLSYATSKMCASFHSHQWIQTGVTVQKLSSEVLTSGTLTSDLWPWPFAWTSLLPLVITPENFMMIRWQEHCEKGVTDGQKCF